LFSSPRVKKKGKKEGMLQKEGRRSSLSSRRRTNPPQEEARGGRPGRLRISAPRKNYQDVVAEAGGKEERELGLLETTRPTYTSLRREKSEGTGAPFFFYLATKKKEGGGENKLSGI